MRRWEESKVRFVLVAAGIRHQYIEELKFRSRKCRLITTICLNSEQRIGGLLTAFPQNTPELPTAPALVTDPHFVCRL